MHQTHRHTYYVQTYVHGHDSHTASVVLLQSLSHCELITDEGIGHLGGSMCAAESLTLLELDNCPLITDASLGHLNGCQHLQRIELYDCQLITHAGIHRLKVGRRPYTDLKEVDYLRGLGLKSA